MPCECFNKFTVLLKEISPKENLVFKDLYKIKKLVSKLGLSSKRLTTESMIRCYTRRTTHMKLNANFIECLDSSHKTKNNANKNVYHISI